MTTFCGDTSTLVAGKDPRKIVNFFGLLLTSYYDYMCSKMDFRQEKAIFIKLLESPIPPLTALQMIICKRPVHPDDLFKRPAPPDDHLQESGASR